MSFAGCKGTGGLPYRSYFPRADAPGATVVACGWAFTFDVVFMVVVCGETVVAFIVVSCGERLTVDVPIFADGGFDVVALGGGHGGRVAAGPLEEHTKGSGCSASTQKELPAKLHELTDAGSNGSGPRKSLFCMLKVWRFTSAEMSGKLQGLLERQYGEARSSTFR